MTRSSVFEILVLIIAASHVITVALLILWLGLRKPLTAREFWRRFKREFFTLGPPAR